MRKLTFPVAIGLTSWVWYREAERQTRYARCARYIRYTLLYVQTVSTCAALQKLVNTIADTGGRTLFTEKLLISSCSWRAAARDRHPAQRMDPDRTKSRMNNEWMSEFASMNVDSAASTNEFEFTSTNTFRPLYDTSKEMRRLHSFTFVHECSFKIHSSLRIRLGFERTNANKRERATHVSGRSRNNCHINFKIM